MDTMIMDTLVGMRDGIALDKGTVLTTDFLDDNANTIKAYLNFWLLYPDCFLDAIKPVKSPISLYFYQRIALRASIRYRYHSLTATRATSKSFIALLSMILRAIFLPGSKLFTCADVKGTAIKVTKQKLDEILSWWPLLANEIEKINTGTDYIDIWFKNKSYFTVVSMTSAGRGNRANGGVVEESATIDGTALQEIIIPMMNIDRKDALGRVVPGESNQQQTYITTAGSKNCFMYQKLIELVTLECIEPDDYFVWGMDYRIPVYHGLLSKKYLDEQRLSTTFSEESFARESMSIWTGQSKDSWFNNKMLIRSRNMLTYETESSLKLERNSEMFYVVGVDVGRYGANSVIIVLKVEPRAKAWKKKLVYIEVIHGENFLFQVPKIKRVIKNFNPREVVIDGNGLGAGLIDSMVMDTYDPKTGEFFPAYYVFNDPKYLPKGYKNPPNKSIPEDNILIYNLKANASNDSEINSNCYSQIMGGMVDFLANERIVKTKLLSTEFGRKMTPYDRQAFLYPYIMTSRLMDELNNLKLKPTGVQNQIKIERISKTIEKDRYSALAYALYRVKEYEDNALRKVKKHKTLGNYVFSSNRHK